MRDVLTTALNTPVGRLTEVLLKRIRKGENGSEMPDVIRRRLDQLVSAPGEFGKLARVRVAVEVSSLFEKAPNWTAERVVPIFEWRSPEAADAWHARRYSNYIGSAKLFELTRQSFLELFRRPEMTHEDLRVYGTWITVLMLANRTRDAKYPITATDARSALRAAGTRVLPSVAHRLAIEMESIKLEQKHTHWVNVVGPVFESIWPLDAELQSSSATFNLVQILRASGDAFPQAAEVIIPFIRPEDPCLLSELT